MHHGGALRGARIAWRLTLRTGHLVLLCRMKQRAPDFCAFLREVRRRYRGCHIALLLDGDSSHTARASRQLAATLGITLSPARAYSSRRNSAIA